MALKSDVNYSNIDGATAYMLPEKFNGQVVFDGNIQPVAKTMKFIADENNEIILSGTMCNIVKTNNETQLVLPDADNKGADVNYIIAGKEQGIYKCYDKDNKNINYYYFNDNTKIQAIYLTQGLRLWIKSTEILTEGDYACNSYSASKLGECSIKKAVANDTAFLFVEQGCPANGLAQVVVCDKKVIS